MAQEAEHLQGLLNTFRVEDTEVLPEPQEKPQISMDSDSNKKEKSDQVVLDEKQKKEENKNIKTKDDEESPPFK